MVVEKPTWAFDSGPSLQRKVITVQAEQRTQEHTPRGRPKVAGFEMRKMREKPDNHEARYKLEHPDGKITWIVWQRINGVGLREEVIKFWKEVEERKGLTDIQRKVRSGGHW
ncbi:hypothetical protein I302_101311 [Kwoniella bestiolae CBS 10118]|uniref:Uncharacterized protein n=1 Tax=Kwoniella bestiolae CBS 10118 TaxID=1296100 RepID=A0A1B9G7K5_9TREE|nr:hypothetical protein I302_04685 [Kwoniella bestiolae CBS 10118]OCF26993.1 hypothetical protein I302_04685 [Kwoniella bestiolae CBS 10118]